MDSVSAPVQIAGNGPFQYQSQMMEEIVGRHIIRIVLQPGLIGGKETGQHGDGLQLFQIAKLFPEISGRRWVVCR